MEAQSQVAKDAFYVDVNWDGIPAGISVHSVSKLTVNFEETPISSAKSISGTEQHQCYDPSRAKPNNVTFDCHGTKDQIKAMHDWAKAIGEGDESKSRGTITVNLVNVKKNREVFLSCSLIDCNLVAFNPFGPIYPHRPDTKTFSFEVACDRMELKA
jgi:hypothetical protein